MKEPLHCLKRKNSPSSFLFPCGTFCCPSPFSFVPVECCSFFRLAESSDGFATPVFILAVLLISRFTSGYLFGLVASLLGVICVNYIFTYPYLSLNFTLSGYPLSFLAFFMVSIITSTLTTQASSRRSCAWKTKRRRAGQPAAFRLPRYPHAADVHRGRHLHHFGSPHSAPVGAEGAFGGCAQ